MQKTIEVTVCDVEFGRSQQVVDATTHTVAIDGQSYEIDLSDAIDREILDPVREVLATYGRLVKGTGAKAAGKAAGKTAGKTAAKTAAAKTTKAAAATARVNTGSAPASANPDKYPCQHRGCDEAFGHGRTRKAHYDKVHPGWTPPTQRSHSGKTATSRKVSPARKGPTGRRGKPQAAVQPATVEPTVEPTEPTVLAATVGTTAPKRRQPEAVAV